MKLEKFPIFLIFPYFPAFSNLQLCKSKNPQGIQQDSVENSVDNVDNLLSKELFAHFYNISGPHSYQQVAVDTIFKKECLDRVETREIVGIRPQRGNLFRQCPRADSQIVRLPGCIDVRENHMVRCG